MLANVPDTLQTFFAPQIEQLGLREIRAEFGGWADLPADLGEGYLWVAGLGPYCLLSVHDFTLRESVPLKEYPADSFALSLMTANMAELAPVPSFPAKREENILAFHQSDEEVHFTMPGKTRCRSTTLCFLPEYFDRAAALTDVDPNELRHRFEQAAPNLLPSAMRACLRSLRPNPQGGSEAALRYAGLALEALSLITEPMPLPQATSRERELVNHARTLMKERLAKRFTLEDLAGQLFVSKSTLCKAFRHVEGKGPSEVMTQLKMNHARRLLLESDLPISAIAFEVGFAHQSSFCDAYKRYYGMSPLQARRFEQQFGSNL